MTGGVPVTVVACCATPPWYGVTVYEVIGEPPSGGAVQVTEAEPLLAVATTPLGAPGAVGAPSAFVAGGTALATAGSAG